MVLLDIANFDIAHDALRTVSRGVGPVAAIGIIITAIYMIKNPREIDLGPIQWIFLVIVGIANYVTLASAIQGAINAIIEAIEPDRSIITRLTELAMIMDTDSAWTIFPSLRTWITNALAESVAGAVVSVIRHFQQIVLLFLYITGPISIVLSTIPPFRNVFQHWFRNFLAVQCWGITFAILDWILLLVTGSSQSTTSSGIPGANYVSVDSAMIDTWVIIISYLFVSTLTMYYIGRNEGGQITRQVTQTVAQLAIAVKTMGASAAAKGAMSQAKAAQSFGSSAGSMAKPEAMAGGGTASMSGNYSSTPGGAGFSYGGGGNSQAQSVYNEPRKKETVS